MATPQIRTFVLGEFQTNCFVVSLPGESEAWIVDCGYEPEPMLAWIEQAGLKPSALGEFFWRDRGGYFGRQ